LLCLAENLADKEKIKQTNLCLPPPPPRRLPADKILVDW
jgi:hypothetical protein